MSRCFPFPPPGYEKKARPDDTDLLKKEKRREKKQNKEDREKKDGKEKKENDASEGKDKKEKKDRKEKHRDKKKDKEKDRNKDKATSINSNEKKLTENPEGRNGEILGKKEDWKKVTNTSSHEKRFSQKSFGINGEKLSRNSLLAYESKDAKFVQDLGKRISDGDRAVENQSTAENFMGGGDRKKNEVMAGFVANDSGALAAGKDRNKVKNAVDRRMAGPWSRDGSEFGGTPLLHKLHRSLDKTIEKMEGKDKDEKTDDGDEKRGGKHGDKDSEKKSQKKDNNRDKEKKKEEKDKLELKFAEQDILKKTQKNGHVGIHNNKMPDLSNDRHIVDSIDGNLKKRKAPETNGFLHDTGTTLIKRPCLDSSHIPRPLVENGRVLEPIQASTKLTSNQQAAIPNNHIVDKKKQKINGMIGQTVSSSSMKPASSIKPPHPDSKYLDLILSVTKVEELPDYDDQEWLFASKKPKVGDSCSTETPQVWDKAMQIDSADICALPYVIPY